MIEVTGGTGGSIWNGLIVTAGKGGSSAPGGSVTIVGGVGGSKKQSTVEECDEPIILDLRPERPEVQT